MSSVLPDQRILVHDLRWTDFELLVSARGDRSVPRVAFSDGTLQLMRPSMHHERIKTLLARLLEAWAEEHDIALDGYGSWTVKDPVHERGLALARRGRGPDVGQLVVVRRGGPSVACPSRPLR